MKGRPLLAFNTYLGCCNVSGYFEKTEFSKAFVFLPKRINDEYTDSCDFVDLVRIDMDFYQKSDPSVLDSSDFE